MFPSVNFNYGNNALTFNDIIVGDPDSDSSLVDIDGAIEKMSDENILQLQSGLTVFGTYYAYR